MAEAMGRLMSLILRIGIAGLTSRARSRNCKTDFGIGGARSYGFGKRRVLSLPDAVGQALAENYLNISQGTEDDGQGAEMGSRVLRLQSAHLTTCQPRERFQWTSAELWRLCIRASQGCQTCYSCGYSEC